MPPKRKKPTKHERSGDHEEQKPERKKKTSDETNRNNKSKAMVDDLQTDLCELGNVDLVGRVLEFVDFTAANAIALKSLNKVWRFTSMMARHWEGAIFCKQNCHMLLNPTKLQKPNAEKDAWCCNSFDGDYCTCNIPKCLKNDDELRDKEGSKHFAFEFLAIDFALSHDEELRGWTGGGSSIGETLRGRQPNIDNVFFDSWPQDDVVAIRFFGYSKWYGAIKPHNDKEINNKLLERFGSRNLRLFVPANAPISTTALANSTQLKWLDLGKMPEHNMVNEDTLSTVVKLPQLKVLGLDWCNKIPKESFKLLRDNTSIEALSCQGICFCDEDEDCTKGVLATLSQKKGLRSLNLSQTHGLSETVSKCLIKNGTPLESLALQWCSFNTEAELSHIADIQTLRVLDLDGCAYPGQDGRPEANDSNIQAIAKKLPRLEALKVRACNLTEEGIAAVGTLANLRCLILECVAREINSQVINTAIGGLTELRVLSLKELGGCDVQRLEFLAKLTHLEVFGVEDSWGLNPEAFSPLKHLTKLRKLNISCCAVKNAGLAHIAHLTEIESLNIERTQIDDKGLQHLRGLTKLRRLFVGDYNKMSDAGLLHLTSMKKLEVLDVSKCAKVTAAGVIRCVAKLSALKCLRVNGLDADDVEKAFPHVVVVRSKAKK